MMILQAIVLGIVQGLTEFIPVSSSGHLIGIRHLLGWDNSLLAGKTFDVALHMGTLVALVAYYWRDWISILRSLFAHVIRGASYAKDAADSSGRLMVPILVACIPAAFVGWAFERIIDEKFSEWYIVAPALVIFGIVMLIAERACKKQRTIGQMNYVDYISIGCAQALALIPGVSRSGITISTGLFRNLDRSAAARFSFLLSTPIVFGAGLKKLHDMSHTGLPHNEMLPFAVGFVVSAIVGYAAIRFLINFLQTRTMNCFAFWRFCLAALLVAVGLLFR